MNEASRATVSSTNSLLARHGIDPGQPHVARQVDDYLAERTDARQGNVAARAAAGSLAVPAWSDFCAAVSQIGDAVRAEVPESNGSVASYIPILADADPSLFAISVCTVDGQRFSYGDASALVSMQSTAKPFTYAIALHENGLSAVHSVCGFEASGLSYNEVSLNAAGKPHNPMVNAGSIAIGALLAPHLRGDNAGKFRHYMDRLQEFAGGAHLSFSHATYLCEHETAWRNRALVAVMQDAGVFDCAVSVASSSAAAAAAASNPAAAAGGSGPAPAAGAGAGFGGAPASAAASAFGAAIAAAAGGASTPADALDFYLQSCSVEVNTDQAAAMAATLANGGLCPLTGRRVVSPEVSRHVLGVALSSGLYDYSGTFMSHVGLPAKSGVSGLLWAVVPGVMGIAVLSPPLDAHGNSTRGLEVCKRLARRFAFGLFDRLMAGKGREQLLPLPIAAPPADLPPFATFADNTAVAAGQPSAAAGTSTAAGTAAPGTVAAADRTSYSMHSTATPAPGAVAAADRMHSTARPADSSFPAGAMTETPGSASRAGRFAGPEDATVAARGASALAGSGVKISVGGRRWAPPAADRRAGPVTDASPASSAAVAAAGSSSSTATPVARGLGLAAGSSSSAVASVLRRPADTDSGGAASTAANPSVAAAAPSASRPKSVRLVRFAQEDDDEEGRARTAAAAEAAAAAERAAVRAGLCRSRWRHAMDALRRCRGTLRAIRVAAGLPLSAEHARSLLLLCRAWLALNGPVCDAAAADATAAAFAVSAAASPAAAIKASGGGSARRVVSTAAAAAAVAAASHSRTLSAVVRRMQALCEALVSSADGDDDGGAGDPLGPDHHIRGTARKATSASARQAKGAVADADPDCDPAQPPLDGLTADADNASLLGALARVIAADAVGAWACSDRNNSMQPQLRQTAHSVAAAGGGDEPSAFQPVGRAARRSSTDAAAAVSRRAEALYQSFGAQFVRLLATFHLPVLLGRTAGAASGGAPAAGLQVGSATKSHGGDGSSGKSASTSAPRDAPALSKLRTDSTGSRLGGMSGAPASVSLVTRLSALSPTSSTGSSVTSSLSLSQSTSSFAATGNGGTGDDFAAPLRALLPSLSQRPSIAAGALVPSAGSRSNASASTPSKALNRDARAALSTDGRPHRPLHHRLDSVGSLPVHSEAAAAAEAAAVAAAAAAGLSPARPAAAAIALDAASASRADAAPALVVAPPASRAVQAAAAACSVPVPALHAFLESRGLCASPGHPLLWAFWTAITMEEQTVPAAPVSAVAAAIAAATGSPAPSAGATTTTLCPRAAVSLADIFISSSRLPGKPHVERRNLVIRALCGRAAIPDFPSFIADVEFIHDAASEERSGALAANTHIAEVESADPEAFALSVVSVDGQVTNVGGHCLKDVPLLGTIRPLLYALACADCGVDGVREWVASEPTAEDATTFALQPPRRTPRVVPTPQQEANQAAGRSSTTAMASGAAPAAGSLPTPFSASAAASAAAAAAAALDDPSAAPPEPQPHPRAFNACLDSGALAVCSMLGRAHMPPSGRLFRDNGSRFRRVQDELTRVCGGRRPGFANAAFLAQKQLRLKTRAVAFFMKGLRALPPAADPAATAEMLYQCEALEMPPQSVAIAAATLANAGVCPLTGEAVLPLDAVRSTLSLMFSSGLGGASGHWGFTVGAPAAAGASGMVMVVIPRVAGLCIYSPRLAARGCLPPRALAAAEMLASKYRIALFDLAAPEHAAQAGTSGASTSGGGGGRRSSGLTASAPTAAITSAAYGADGTALPHEGSPVAISHAPSAGSNMGGGVAGGVGSRVGSGAALAWSFGQLSPFIGAAGHGRPPSPPPALGGAATGAAMGMGMGVGMGGGMGVGGGRAGSLGLGLGLGIAGPGSPILGPSASSASASWGAGTAALPGGGMLGPSATPRLSRHPLSLSSADFASTGAAAGAGAGAGAGHLPMGAGFDRSPGLYPQSGSALSSPRAASGAHGDRMSSVTVNGLSSWLLGGGGGGSGAGTGTGAGAGAGARQGSGVPLAPAAAGMSRQVSHGSFAAGLDQLGTLPAESATESASHPMQAAGIANRGMHLLVAAPSGRGMNTAAAHAPGSGSGTPAFDVPTGDDDGSSDASEAASDAYGVSRKPASANNTASMRAAARHVTLPMPTEDAADSAVGASSIGLSLGSIEAGSGSGTGSRSMSGRFGSPAHAVTSTGARAHADGGSGGAGASQAGTPSALTTLLSRMAHSSSASPGPGAGSRGR